MSIQVTFSFLFSFIFGGAGMSWIINDIRLITTQVYENNNMTDIIIFGISIIEWIYIFTHTLHKWSAWYQYFEDNQLLLSDYSKANMCFCLFCRNCNKFNSITRRRHPYSTMIIHNWIETNTINLKNCKNTIK
jgi:hypothetical protein